VTKIHQLILRECQSLRKTVYGIGTWSELTVETPEVEAPVEKSVAVKDLLGNQ
jgi:hypothetical protein